MAEKHALLRKPDVTERRPAAAARRPVTAAAAARPPPAARRVQQRLGNQGAQALAAQVVARSSRPGATAASGAATGQLSLSRPGDAHEREAERVADKVMRMAEPAPGLPGIAGVSAPEPASLVHRRCAACDEEHAQAMQREAQGAAIAPQVQRQEATAATPRVTPSVSADIRSLQGKGEPLPPPARAFFEPRFGADFSQVRTHTDAHAARTAGAIDARAFTVGADIAFGAGQFSPDSQAGRHLLAHELTHVVQQGRSSVAQAAGAASTVQRDAAPPKPVAPDDPAMLSQLDEQITLWEANAAQDADLMLRAKASRMVLLLTGWGGHHPTLKTQEDLDNFTADCDKRAETELGTLGVFKPAFVELALKIRPEGFPLTWSQRVGDALSLGIDLADVFKAALDEILKWAVRSVALGPKLASHGLPVPFEKLERLDDFRLTIADANAEKPSPVREFAGEGIRHVQLVWIYAFAIAWELKAAAVAAAVADGTRVPKYADWKDFVDNKQKILRGLPARARDRLGRTDEEVEKLQTDSLALGDAALAVGVASSLASMVAILNGWKDVTEQFGLALESADAMVASGGAGDHLVKAPKWAWDNDYFKGAAIATSKAMLAQGPEALAEMALLMAVSMIPPLDIPLALYLRVKMGVDVTEMLVELATTIKDIAEAKTVGKLQKGAAGLAALLARAVLFGTILAVTWGVGKAVSKLKQNKAALKKANPALTEEDATRKAMEQLSKEEREALAGTQASLAKRIVQKIEEFAGVCRLGSFICDSVPVSIQKEAGALPATKYNVPPPKGSLVIQHSGFAKARRRPAYLRAQVLKHPNRWPHLVEAMKANGGKWPSEKRKPWEVHHIKPVAMGGTNDIDNLFPLPPSEHALLTGYWNRVRLAFLKRFTKEEWSMIYTKSTKDVLGADVPASPLPKGQK